MNDKKWWKNLVPFRLAPNWEIKWNKLQNLEPDTIEESDDAWLYVFVEDMLYMQTSFTYKRNKKSIKHTLAIDLGWYPEGNIKGSYYLYAILDNNWDTPILEFKTRSTQKVAETMELWMFEEFQRSFWWNKVQVKDTKAYECMALCNTNNKVLGEKYMCRMCDEYEYKIVMYIWEGYTAFYQMEEQENGYFVPVRRLSGSKGEVSYKSSVDENINGIELFKKYENKNNYYQELNIYQELVGTSSQSKEAINSERLFWENVICIHFYVKPNGEYTIAALQRGDNPYNYIKKIHIPNNYFSSEFQDVVLELIEDVHNYRENPKQTPVNIEEYRKDESVGKHRFPWDISIFKGEKRLLIIPYLDHAAGFRRQPDKMVILDENASALEIGNGIMEVIEIMKSSPRLSGNTQGYQLATKYKGWKSFSKRNKLVKIHVNEDFSYKIYAEECPNSDGIYRIVGDEKNIESDITVEGLGKCIIDCFEVFHSVNYKEKKDYDPYPIKNLELMDGSSLTVKHPSDRHFYDYEDAHAGEIYQCYCYMVHEEGESSAEFFVGIAPEIDCNLEPENVCSSWQEVYGKAELFEMKEDAFGIFEYRAEMKNKITHRISYFLQMEEDLILECGMDVHQPNRRKKLDEKLVYMFQDFAKNCKKQ